MTTGYSMGDTLPKDAGAQKFMALTNVDSATNDFALLKGIGASTIQGKIMAHMAVGTHTQASKIEAEHPLTAVGGVYIENAATQASPQAPGTAQMAGMTNWQEIFARPAPTMASHVSTSANSIKAGSGIVYGMTVTLSEVNLGAVVRLRDGTGDRLTFVGGSEFGTWNVKVPEGGIQFDTSILSTATFTGTGASVTVYYR